MISLDPQQQTARTWFESLRGTLCKLHALAKGDVKQIKIFDQLINRLVT